MATALGLLTASADDTKLAMLILEVGQLVLGTKQALGEILSICLGLIVTFPVTSEVFDNAGDWVTQPNGREVSGLDPDDVEELRAATPCGEARMLLSSSAGLRK